MRKKEKNFHVVDRLSLAYAKIGENDKAVDFLNSAYKYGVIDSIFKDRLEYKCDILESTLPHVYELNPDIENSNGSLSMGIQKGKFDGTDVFTSLRF